MLAGGCDRVGLIRDNKILLKKLVKSYNFKSTYMRCDLNLCRVGVAKGPYRIIYLPIFKVESDAIAFIEDKNDIYVCVDLDKVYTENNLRLFVGVSNSKDISKYMNLEEGFKDLFSKYTSIIRDRISLNSFRAIDSNIVKFMHEEYPDLFDLQTLMTSDGFTKAVQFIKDNSLQDAYFNYVRTFMHDKFSVAVHNLLNGDITFNLTKDAYFKNNKIAFARINFKEMIMYVYTGDYFDKVTLSSKSSHVDMYDISDIIKRIDSTSRLMFSGISSLFPNLVGESVIS
mgnify:CR=1 FL=1